MTSDTSELRLNLIETMFICEHYKNIGYYQSPLHVNPSQTDSFCRSWGDSSENLRKLSADGKFPHQEIRRSSGKWKQRLLFAVIYLCLLFTAGAQV